MDPLDALFEWLLDGAPGASNAPQVVERIAADTRAGGIQLDRIGVFVTTLHPNIFGQGLYWRPDAPTRVANLSVENQRSPDVLQSPIGEVWRTRSELRRRLRDVGPDDYPLLRQLAGEGFTDFIALPIIFTSGQMNTVTFATLHPDGFGEAQIATLRQLIRPLARVAEIFALRRVATNLLDTYVGHNAGARILAGRISRGDIETIDAVVWFSDLRGFTELTARQTPRETIDMLNELFECQVPAITAAGGEVLKFIGDGLLAIFPISDPATAPARCLAALDAVDAAFAALATRNQAAAHSIEFGVALHVGEVAYGNIGGASRLDFTAIGAAINLAARLEGLTARLGRTLVTSAEFAAHVATSGRLAELGAFELKGMPAPQRVFGAVQVSSRASDHK